MKMMSVVKGVAAGAAVGTAAYLLSNSSQRQRSTLKRSAGRAMRSFVNVLDNLTDMI